MENISTVEQLQEKLDEKCFVFGIENYKITEYVKKSDQCPYIVYGLSMIIENDFIMFIDLDDTIIERSSILMVVHKRHFLKISVSHNIINIDLGNLGYIIIEEL